ncbi:MAG: DUF2314 domain-containing protein [Phycisphaerae bacterium]|nr:DUF2314 domain-containing protein [Phycisphaerae bacterium]
MDAWLIWGLVAAGVVLAAVAVWLVLRWRAGRNAGPLSIVLLRRTAPRVTQADVRGIARRALGVEAQVSEIPMPDGQAVAMPILADGAPPIAVIAASRRYIEDDEVESVAQGCEDPRMRAAMREHAGWVSVDAVMLNRMPPASERAPFYAVLARVALEFMDDDVLMLYLPADNYFLEAGESGRERLRSGRLIDPETDGSLNAPIYAVPQDDAKINAAIKKAQQRLPELVSAWERRGADCQAMIKGRFTGSNGEVEYMWLELRDITETHFVGEVGNEPLHPGVAARGSTARVKSDDVVDWAFADEQGEPQGLFVESVLRKRK